MRAHRLHGSTAPSCPQVPRRGLTIGRSEVKSELETADLGRLRLARRISVGSGPRPFYGTTPRAASFARRGDRWVPVVSQQVATRRCDCLRARTLAVATAVTFLVSACTGSPSAAPLPTPSPSTASNSTAPVASSPTPTDRERVLTQYAEFFKVFLQASRLTEAPRNQLLSRYLTGHAYTSAVSSLSAQAAFGKVGYGTVVVRPEVISIDASSAVVRDCQDTSNSGVKDRKSGHKETKGIPRALVVTNFRTDNSVWKISKIDYRGAKC